MDDLIIDPAAPLWVVIYYFIMWALNTFGYFLSGYSIGEIAKVLHTSRLYLGLKIASTILYTFGAFRGVSGIVGLILFGSQTSGTTETIEILGVVSLFLNTTFINIFGVTSFIESRKLKRIGEKRQGLVVAFAESLENLSKTVEVSKRIAKDKVHSSQQPGD